MKKLLSLCLLVLFLSACGTEEKNNLEVSTNAYAFDLGDGAWEVNATSIIKGFKQNENNETFTASLTYEVDIVTPAGNTLKSLVNKTEDKSEKEKISDFQIETQLNLDSTYAPGKYRLVFRVKDVLSEQADSASAEFEITPPEKQSAEAI